MGGDAHIYGWKLLGFKSHGFAAVGEFFIPGYIVMFTFMAVYHFNALYLRVDLK
jgi:hypothetical protein